MIDCQYCNTPAALLRRRDENYPYRQDYGPVWTCVSCHAWCGCHPGTNQALGLLANEELRIERRRAHEAFDPIWEKQMTNPNTAKSQSRSSAYKWLAEKMRIPLKQTHIGKFSVTQCKQVVDICNKYQMKTV